MIIIQCVTIKRNLKNAGRSISTKTVGDHWVEAMLSWEKRRGTSLYLDIILNVEQLARSALRDEFVQVCTHLYLALKFWHFKCWQKCTSNLLLIVLFTSEFLQYGCRWKQHHHKMFFPQVKASDSHACQCVAGCWMARQGFTQLELKSIAHGWGETQCADIEAFCRGCTTACGALYKSTTQLMTNAATQPWSEVQPPSNGTLSTFCAQRKASSLPFLQCNFMTRQLT